MNNSSRDSKERDLEVRISSYVLCYFFYFMKTKHPHLQDALGTGNHLCGLYLISSDIEQCAHVKIEHLLTPSS
jgi:hypothetical protein